MNTRARSRASLKGAATLLSALFVLAAGAAAHAQSADNPADVIAAGERDRFTFTLRAPSFAPSEPLDFSQNPDVELSAGEKWRFTFSIDAEDQSRFELDDVRAGAFFDITPRVRFGGQLSFSDPDDAITQSGDFNRDAPEVKFESAFRF